MNKITLNAYAKINATLEILSKNSDGYHNLSTIMLPVSLADEVTVEVFYNDNENQYSNIKIICDNPDVPTDEKNTVFKAVKLFFSHQAKKPYEIKIKINKNIPTQAGLGGGSTDAAAVLKALNMMPGITHLDINTLNKIAFEIGSDVPFCLFGKAALCTSKGEIMKPFLESFFRNYERIIIIKPDFSFSTKDAFNLYDRLSEPSSDGELSEFQKLLQNSPIKHHNFQNDFEIAHNDKRIFEIERDLISSGAYDAILTGSGSAVFGVFKDEKNALKAEKQLKEKYQNIWLVKEIFWAY